MRILRRLPGLLALGMLTSSLGCVSSKLDLQTAGVRYKQWADAIRLTNGTVELNIIPSLGGRIMRYGFVNGPNALWERPADSPQLDPSGWNNCGGDKVWPWPQNDWQKRFKHAWPPPAEVDQMPVTVNIINAHKVELIAPPMPNFGGRHFSRTITLDPTGTGVTIETKLSATTQPDTSPPVAAWEIAQVPMPDALLVRNATASAGSQPFSLDAGSALFALRSWTAKPLSNSIWQLTPKLANTFDLCETNADGLIHIRHGLALVQRNMPLPAPPGSIEIPGEQNRVYLDDRPTHPADRYVELEWVAARVPSQAGASDSVLQVRWSLAHLEDGPINGAVAAALFSAEPNR